MKRLGTHSPSAATERRGAVLLLSFLILMVVIAIVYQLNRVTGTDQQVADKDLTMTRMDLAIESALLEVSEQLLEDGEMRQGAEEGAGGAGAGGDAGGDPSAGDGGGGDEAGGGESNPDAVDSQMDEWAQVAATTINEIDMRILIQDEDRKYNVLNMLAEDPEEAQDAYDRVIRILDLCREGTDADIGGAEADEMARVIRDHMVERTNSYLPRPAELLNDDEENDGIGIPLTLREVVVLEPFTENHFRDFFDPDDNRVHSIGSFLTVFTSPYTDGESGVVAGGGYAVNVNTAPLAVLVALMDSRDVDTRFWDQVIEYRNLEEELSREEQEETEPMLDEFGEELLQRRFFDNLEELGELPDWESMEPDVRAKLETLLRVESDVFSIFISARKSTADERNQVVDFQSRLEQEIYERSGAHLVRTVRAVVWRQLGEEESKIVPIIRWEVLDYAPLPVLDYPDEGSY